MKNSPKLEIVSHVNRFIPQIKDFEPFFGKGIAALGEKKSIEKHLQYGIIQLVFVDDEEIKLINAEYRGKNKPTDVISLSYLEEKDFPGRENLLGEIIISLETAKKQAKEHSHSLKKELLFLFIHGLLHIFGYDHETPQDREKMFDLQYEITG
jgi:probable rRNA maturation factor